MNLNTPKAILIGFALVALAVLFQPVLAPLIVPPAYGQGLDYSDFQMLSDRLSDIASAIRSCR